MLKGLLTGEDADSKERGYGRALIDAIERLSGDAREQNECSLTWTINSLHKKIEGMGSANSTESVGAALMDAVQRPPCRARANCGLGGLMITLS